MFKVLNNLLAYRRGDRRPTVIDGYQAAVGLPLVTWPHHSPGTVVQLIAKQNACWRYIAKPGDRGVVVKLAQGSGPKNYAEEDLYVLRMEGKTRLVYAYFNEIRLAG